jgi:N-acylneuraminate cytidylyltransferase
MTTVAIVLARGGSKGIPKKNVIDFCGKPLLGWTLEQCLAVKEVDSVWVSSDCEEIINVGNAFGARTIKRPAELSGDNATSEAGWLHALDVIEKEMGTVDVVVAPQATSPLREPKDIASGLEIFRTGQFDSLFSCSLAEDLYFWQKSQGILQSVNYDWRNRKRRQDHAPQFIENGSFYIFSPYVLRSFRNRFGERIGLVEMEFWKTFEIDSPETLRICAALMREFILTSSSS